MAESLIKAPGDNRLGKLVWMRIRWTNVAERTHFYIEACHATFTRYWMGI
jgi:hypothetical protein